MSDTIIGSKERPDSEFSQEEKQEQAAKRLAEQMVKKQFKTQFLQVLDEVVNKGKTLDAIIEEVNQKKSRMTASAREFVVNFKQERIQEWIDEATKKEE